MAIPTLDNVAWLEKSKSMAKSAASSISDSAIDLRDSTEKSLAEAPRQRRWMVIAIVLGACAFVVLLIAETVLGAVLQTRSQQVLAPKFAQTLAIAAGAADTPDLTPLPSDAPRVGDPVAVLRIPKLGVQQVVVEGQDTRSLQNGPGHVLGTSMPGQAGSAAIVGRRTTFGAPFRSLAALTPGSRITATTVEGTATYLVKDVGYRTGDFFAPAARNQLLLVTSGPRLLATDDLVVTAELQGRPFAPTPQNPRTYESPRAGMTSEWAKLLVWCLVFVGVGVATWFVLRRKLIAKTVVWMFTIPVFSAVFILIVRAADTFLPATL